MTSTNERFTFQAKRELQGLVPYEAGLSVEALRREIGGDGPIVKLGSNEGPWGPLPAAVEAIRDQVAGLNRYPDGAFFDLKDDLAVITGAAREQIVLGNGADSILINLSLALLAPGDEVIFGWPSFITYPLSVRKVGAVPVAVPLDADYRYDLDAMLARVSDRTRCVYVCNPNNPTGTYVDRDRLRAFVDALPEHVLCVVDEAYHEYVTAPGYPDGIAELIAEGRPSVMVLRTMSKIYGLAGLRVGWGVGPAEVVRAIDTVRGPFEMNALANAAARASLTERALLAERVASNESGRVALAAALREVGLTPIDGVGNFLCVPLTDGVTGRAVAERMQREGVIVRPLDGFGMPDGFRITVGTPAENEIAVDAMRSVLPELLRNAN